MGKTDGARFGKAIGDHLGEQAVKARLSTMDAENHARDRAREAMWEKLEVEIAAILRSRGFNPAADETLPPEVRKMWESIDVPKNQADFIFNALALIGVALTGAFAASAGINQQLTERGLFTTADIPLTPQEAAGMVTRKLLDPNAGARYAQRNGTKPSTFNDLVNAAFTDVPLDLLLTLHRRELITDEGLRNGIALLGIREGENLHLDRLSVGPPSPADAIQAVVQGHLGDDQARAIMRQNGQNPGDFQWLYETAGEPPGTFDLLELLNRQQIDEQFVIDAIRESRVKNKYIPYILKLRFKIPPQRSIVAMLHAGGIDANQAAIWLKALGFDPIAIAALISEATRTKHLATHELTKSEILGLYEDKLRSAEQTHASLVALGEDADVADAQIALADVRIYRRRLNTAISKVHSTYLAHKIDEHTAAAALTDLGVPLDAQTELFDVWQTEHAVNIKVLSEAQLVAAGKKGAMPWPTVLLRIMQLGYGQDDAITLLATAGVSPADLGA